MTVKNKLVAWIAGIFIGLLLVEIGVIGGLLLPRFGQIETQDALAAMRRIDLGVQSALGALRVSAPDWGNWADTYRFMQTRYAEFADENLNVIAITANATSEDRMRWRAGCTARAGAAP